MEEESKNFMDNFTEPPGTSPQQEGGPKGESDKKKKTKKKKPNKRFILYGAVFLVSFVLLGIAVKHNKKETSTKTPKIHPPGIVKNKEGSPTKPRPAPLRKPPPSPKAPLPSPGGAKPIKIEVERNPFEDYFTKKFLEKLEEKLKRELEAKLARVEPPPPSLSAPPRPPVLGPGALPPDLEEVVRKLDHLHGNGGKEEGPDKVEVQARAIICEGKECYAVLPEGVFKTGDTKDGMKVVVTPKKVLLVRER